MLPTDSPHLAKSAFAMALSPMLWAQHKPDRFDSWSAGIVLLQVRHAVLIALHCAAMSWILCVGVLLVACIVGGGRMLHVQLKGQECPAC